jgi:hypothetical protein
MGLSNADRQARHRAKVKERLASLPSSDCAPADSLLDRLNDAYFEARRLADREAIACIDARGSEWALDGEWPLLRQRILEDSYVERRGEDQWIQAARDQGTKMGEYFALGVYRECLTKVIDAKGPKPEAPKARRRVT